MHEPHWTKYRRDYDSARGVADLSGDQPAAARHHPGAQSRAAGRRHRVHRRHPRQKHQPQQMTAM